MSDDGNDYNSNNSNNNSNNFSVEKQQEKKTYSSYKPMNTLGGGSSTKRFPTPTIKERKSLSLESLTTISKASNTTTSSPLKISKSSEGSLGKVSKFQQGFNRAFKNLSSPTTSPFRLPPPSSLSPRRISNILYPDEEKVNEDQNEEQEVYTIYLSDVVFSSETFSSSKRHSLKMFLDYSILHIWRDGEVDGEVEVCIEHSKINNVILHSSKYIEFVFLELPPFLRGYSSTCNVLRLLLIRKCSNSTMRSIFNSKFSQTSFKSEYCSTPSAGPFLRESPRVLMKKEKEKEQQQHNHQEAVIITSTPAIPYIHDKPKLLFVYQPKKASIPITSNELLRLPEGVYFNDSLIDFGLSYFLDCSPLDVQERTHIFSSYFYKKISSGTITSTSSTTDPFTKHYNFIPINEKLHWYVVLIIGLPYLLDDPAKYKEDNSCCIVIFDSLGVNRRISVIEKIKKYIIGEGIRRYGIEIDRTSIRQICPNLPLQKNGTDCGCFVLLYVQRFLEDPYEACNMLMDKVSMTSWIPENGALLCRINMKSLIEMMTDTSIVNVNDFNDDCNDVIEIV